MSRTLLLLLSCILFSLSSQCQDNPTPPSAGHADSMTFEKVEVEAEFPGGRKSWVTYLQHNLRADAPLNMKAPAGKYQVIVLFIVAKDGTISDIRAETHNGYGMEAEVIRVIKKGPKWIPATQNGKFVNAYRRQPVTFVVAGK